MKEQVSPVLGIVTVTYNSQLFIGEFLRCCMMQSLNDFRLLIIDNASSDQTVNTIQGFDDNRIKILLNKENLGYAIACNQGIAHFRSLHVPEILFINNDTIFDKNLFEDLVLARASYSADSVVPRITYATDPDRNWWAGGQFNYWRGFQAQHLGEGQTNNPLDTLPRFCPVASGCCILFAIDVFDVAGLFDPRLFVYWEDTDFCIRMRSHGLTILYHPGIALRHKVSMSTGGPQSDFSIYYYHRNQIYIIRKYHGPLVLVAQILLIVSKSLFRFLIRVDKFRHFRLRLRAMMAGLVLQLD